MSKNILTFAQKVQLNNKLEELLQRNEDGTSQYIGEVMTDEQIAEMMPFACTGVNVRTLRNEMFGKLTKQNASALNHELSQKIIRLECVVYNILNSTPNLREKNEVLRACWEEMSGSSATEYR